MNTPAALAVTGTGAEILSALLLTAWASNTRRSPLRQQSGLLDADYEQDRFTTVLTASVAS